MRVVMLRAQGCLVYAGRMPNKSRIDRRYCRGACRTLAYRVRRRVSSSQPPGPLNPAWAEPSTVVRTMLTSLAQIQSGVLGFAHQLEKEKLFARPPICTDVGTFAATNSGEKGVFRNRLEDGAQIPLFDDDDEPDSEEDEEAAEQNGKAILRLEQTLKEEKCDAAKQEERAVIAELRAAELAAELTKLRREQLHRPNQALAVWEKAGAEFMTLTANNTTLQQENAALRAEVEWLRPLTPHLDLLTWLMVDRVKTLHWLAVWEAQAGDTVTGIRLPN